MFNFPLTLIVCIASNQGHCLTINADELNAWLTHLQTKINVHSISASIYDAKHKQTLNRTRVHPTKSPPTINHDSQFCFGSLVKSFVAALILKMEEQTRLSTKWSINTFAKKVKHFSYADIVEHFGDVSILSLMNMTSGIYSYTEDYEYKAELKNNKPYTHFNTDESLIHIAQKKPKYFSPGKGWHYSDTAYLILGKLIQSISGHQPATSIENQLIIPFRPYLSNTTLHRTKAINLVPGFNSENKKYDNEIALGSMAREIYSTAADMAKWFALLLTGEVLNDKSMKKLMSLYSKTTGQRINDNETGYSLALDHTTSECGSLWFYPGNSRGYTSFALWLPEQGISASLALNKETDFMAIFLSFLTFIGCPLTEIN